MESRTFFMSDPHYGHKNICRGVTQWKSNEGSDSHQETRDFETVEEMNNAIVEAINSTVGENDFLFCLGDWCFGGIENIWNFRKRIVCKNIFLIYGNHDDHIINNKLLPNVINVNGQLVDGTPEFLSEKVFARQLFVGCEFYKKLSIKNIGIIILCHFAMRVWDKSHKGSIMLFGHSHNSLADYTNSLGQKFKTMDVGIDTRKDFKPYSLEEILEIMSKRIPLKIDHHGPETN